MARTAEGPQRLLALSERIEAALAASLPGQGPSERLLAAMRYALTGGGKRLRPLLVYGAAEISAIPESRAKPIALAVEMIHAYSLIHDDLPAMDDDALRRGRPTCHLAFDEATAILAGDALQSEAFRILATLPHPDPAIPARLVSCLAEAAGPSGMAGGQAMDLALTGGDCDVKTLERLHRLKTGALIEAALVMPALAADTPDTRLVSALSRSGQAIGLAYQIQDDVLDVTAETGVLGKPQGADAARAQPTFATLLGIETARARYLDLYDQASETLHAVETGATLLPELIAYMRDRQH